MSTLLGEDADELKTVEEPHAMANHGAQGLEFGDFGDRKLQRDHFSGAELAGHHRPQPILREFEATAVDAEISFLPQHLDDQRQLSAVAGVAPC